MIYKYDKWRWIPIFRVTKYWTMIRKPTPALTIRFGFWSITIKGSRSC